VKYVILIYANPATWQALPGEEADRIIRDHYSMIDELNRSGEMISQFGLADASNSRTLVIQDGLPVITDGPFSEAKEQLAGVFVVDTETPERVAEIARPLAQGAVVEIRPLMDEGGTEM
jgi:hypothetical protein